MRVWESYPNAWISVQLPKDVQIRVWGYPPKISADPYGSALFQVKGSLVVHLVEAVAGLEQKHGSRQELLDGGTLLENELAPLEKADGRAGSVTITTTALVHGGSTNVDTEPRLSCHMTYAAAEFVEAGFDGIIEFSFPEHWRRLRAQLPPDRRHIVPVPSGHPRL